MGLHQYSVVKKIHLQTRRLGLDPCVRKIPGSGRSPGDLLLENKMATHSSNLAWKIPWTEKPSGLQSMGSQRVRHNLATNSSTSV